MRLWTIKEAAYKSQPLNAELLMSDLSLDDPSATVRDYAFSEHNWHVFAVHQRSVRYGPWIYIRIMLAEVLGDFAEGAGQ